MRIVNNDQALGAYRKNNTENIPSAKKTDKRSESVNTGSDAADHVALADEQALNNVELNRRDGVQKRLDDNIQIGEPIESGKDAESAADEVIAKMLGNPQAAVSAQANFDRNVVLSLL